MDKKCSFCNKPESTVEQLVQSSINDDICICNDCLMLGYDLICEYQPDTNLNNIETQTPIQSMGKNIPKPIEIKDFLDKYVIGQDNAKKSIAVATYNHYKRILSNINNDDELQKSNILLLGPTGSGKTLIAKTIAKILKVPFAIADATSLTEAGYVGEDVENILLKLIHNANGNIELAEKGIIYIDEFDKLARKSENTSITRDVSGEGVQQALLKIIEGTEASVPPNGGRKHPLQEYIKINTNNILFICGGAFEGLEQIVKQRLGKKVIGFNEVATKIDCTNWQEYLDSQDIIKYGLIPELVGRLPIISCLQPLNECTLIDILSKPKNSLVSQYQKLFAIDGINLKFTTEALKLIAQTAIKKNLGARGLRSIMEKIMEDSMFKYPSMKYTSLKIDKHFVENNLKIK